MRESQGRRRVLVLVVFGTALACWIAAIVKGGKAQERREGFRGGIAPSEKAAPADVPRPVRNDVAQKGDEVVTLRYFRIKKGTFDQFLDSSVNGVWPYFEKLGARVIGMWKEVHPVTDMGEAGADNPDYDEVWLMTRYASVEHWRATRDMAAHGGNGPDWVKCREALKIREDLTLESNVRFLEGRAWDNPPWFMPGLDEKYAPASE